MLSMHMFGSLARGDQVGTSDVDVLIVLREVGDKDPTELIRRFYPYFNLPMSIDLLILDKKSIDRRLAQGDEFINRLWKERVDLV